MIFKNSLNIIYLYFSELYKKQLMEIVLKQEQLLCKLRLEKFLSLFMGEFYPPKN